MKKGRAFQGCRYWGVEPACAEFRHDLSRSKAERDAIKRQYNEERAKLIAAHHKPCFMGLRSAAAAEAMANAIEAQTGIEMRTFNHDYL